MHTRHGIFGASGNGEGIFATTVAGLGALGAVDPFAKVPATCWDQFGFKGCSEQANQQANDFLNLLKSKGDINYGPGTTEWTDSFNAIWAENLQKCISEYCGAATTSVSSMEGMIGLPWGTFSLATKDVQYAANDLLPKMQLETLSTDGKLGGKTCGGIKAVIDSKQRPDWVMPRACAGRTLSLASTAPGAPAPAPTPAVVPRPSPVAPPVAYQTSSSSTTSWLVIGAGALLAAGVGYYLYKKKR
jgi:LPXTG-motif cell wall-anchored protein